jgi:transcriptional regulator with XRE-family HTH domain
MSKNNPDILRLGNNIKTIIEKKGYKTREVAHDSNLDVENLRKYIKGTQEMRISTLIKISKSLKVDIKELFEGIL